MKGTFILAGNGPCVNHGCEALVRATTDVLDHSFPGCTIISAPEKQDLVLDEAIVQEPNIVHRPMSFPNRRSWPALSLALKRKLGLIKKYSFEKDISTSSAVLALGGDNFTLDYGPNLPLRQVAIGEHVLAAGRPFVVWGASIGPFSKDPVVEAKVMDFLRKLPLITIRETRTVDYLRSLGVSENVVQVADPAFVLRAREPQGMQDIKAILSAQPVCINLSPLMSKYVGEGPSWFDTAVATLRAIDQAIDRPIILLAHVTWSISDDHAFLAKVKDALGKTKNPVFLTPKELNALELKWLIARVGLLVAARTHATIAAFSQAVPTLSVGYSTKAEGLNRDLFGDDRWLVRVNEFNPESATAKIQEILRDDASIRAGLKEKLPELKARALKGGEALKRIVSP